MRVPLLLLLLAAWPAVAAAQPPASPPPPAAAGQCATSQPPTPGFAAGQAQLGDQLAVNRAVALTLKPVGDLRFPVALARPPAAGALGAVVPLEVTSGGPYRLLLSARAWVDVVRDGAALPSTSHAHGNPCSGIAKIVGYRLQPGRYLVQLSEADSRQLTVKVVRDSPVRIDDGKPTDPPG